MHLARATITAQLLHSHWAQSCSSRVRDNGSPSPAPALSLPSGSCGKQQSMSSASHKNFSTLPDMYDLSIQYLSIQVSVIIIHILFFESDLNRWLHTIPLDITIFLVISDSSLMWLKECNLTRNVVSPNGYETTALPYSYM